MTERRRKIKLDSYITNPFFGGGAFFFQLRKGMYISYLSSLEMNVPKVCRAK